MTQVRVSAEDADLALSSWYMNSTYARMPLAKYRRRYMHQVVAERLGLIGNVDHINGDRLDNRRCNLRAASPQQNARNQTRKSVGHTSKFKGVCWDPWGSRWRAGIMINSKRINLGSFQSEQDAQQAYAAAAVKYFGEFAAPHVEAK